MPESPFRIVRFVLPILLVLTPHLAWAQQADSTRQPVDVSADLLEAEVIGGERVQRLTGNVVVRQDSTTLTSRRATRYFDRGEILFVGNVIIVERGDTLRAPEVRYNTRTKTGVALGPLRLSDGEVVVTAPRGEYFTREKRAEFAEGVQLVDSATVLTSRTGTYFSDEKRAEFAGAVHLDEPRSALDADSVTYLRETKEAWARGNVFVERRGGESDAEADTTTRTFLFGSRVYNDERRDFSRVEGPIQVASVSPDTLGTSPAPDSLLIPPEILADSLRADSLGLEPPPDSLFAPPPMPPLLPDTPLLVQVRFDSTGTPTDTLLLRAATLEAERTDTTQTLRAWGGVRLWTGDYAARADSLFSLRTERDSTTYEDVRFFRDPVAWFDRVQVNADTLQLLATDGDLDTLFARSEAFAAEEDTLTRRLNQLKGRLLTGYFLPDSVRIFEAAPNAEAIRQRVKDGQPDGAVQASADRIVLRFRGDAITRVSILTGVESTIYGENILPPDLMLSGLRWRPEERPQKDVLLGPYVLPELVGSEPDAGASEPSSEPPPDDRR